MLTRPGDDPGGVRLHAETSEAWVSQMASEELKPKSKGGKPTWQLKTAGRANHHWDNFCYTLAVADAWRRRGRWRCGLCGRRIGGWGRLCRGCVWSQAVSRGGRGGCVETWSKAGSGCIGGGRGGGFAGVAGVGGVWGIDKFGRGGYCLGVALERLPPKS